MGIRRAPSPNPEGVRATALIGREAPLARLEAAVADAEAARGSFVLVTGEPGIGKSALCAAVAEHAAARGFAVGQGRGWDGGGAPPFWPWHEATRDLVRAVPVEELEEAEQAAGPALGVFGSEPTSAGHLAAVQDHEDARFRLFDALTSYLAALGSTRPVLVVLDDLHWADSSSLELLRFTAPRLARSRVLLIGAYRDVEIVADHPLRDAIGALRVSAELLPLGGLDAPAVGRICETVIGTSVSPELAREVYSRTGGNPLFVREVARLLPGTDDASPGALPQGVRDVIQRRLARLSEPCMDMLGVAAGLGRPVDASLIAAVAGATAADISPLLEEAGSARVLVAANGGFVFAHDLFRETVYAELPAAFRDDVHGRIAVALEARSAGGRPVPSSELALHFSLASPSSVACERAVRYGLEAAQESLKNLAPVEALEHAERVLLVLDRGDQPGPPRGGEALLTVGEAARQAGDPTRASDALDRAAGDARARGDRLLLARVALAAQRVPHTYSQTNDRTRALLDEAVSCAEPASAEGVLVRAALARHDYHDRRQGAPHELAREAVRLAEELGDPEVLSFALFAEHDTMWGPGTADARLGVAERMERTAESSGQAEIRGEAALLAAAALFELLDSRAASALVRAVYLLGELSQPYCRYLSLTRRVALLTARGEFAEADRLREHAALLAAASREADAWNVEMRELWVLRTLQGRRGELEARVREWQAPMFNAWYDGQLVLTIAAAGRTTEARELFDARLAAWDPSIEPFDNIWLTQTSTVAEAAIAVGDRRAAQRLSEALLPYSGLGVVTAGAVDFSGAVDHYLGILAARREDPDEAVVFLERALAAHQRIGATAWARRSEAELTALGVVPTAAEGAGGVGVFRRDDGVWQLRFAGRTARVKDAKGIRDLAVLLAQPGRAVPARELAGATGDAAVAAEASLGADAVLDDQARTTYRARLRELEAELTEAEENNAPERVARAHWEHDVLVEELTAAIGLGGRTRQLGSGVERARKAVTARIRDSIRRITEVHPELGEHLTLSVATGTTCRYDPAEPVAWRL